MIRVVIVGAIMAANAVMYEAKTVKSLSIENPFFLMYSAWQCLYLDYRRFRTK